MTGTLSPSTPRPVGTAIVVAHQYNITSYIIVHVYIQFNCPVNK